MLINLWSTPRTGSNWYARKLVKDHENITRAYSISELFNKNIYTYYYKDEGGKIYFLKDYGPGCFYNEYSLDTNDGLIETRVYEERTRSPIDEEMHRISLVRKVNKGHVMILSNHVSPINEDIYKELCKLADRNIYLHRKSIKDQLSSYGISFATKQFISFTEDYVPIKNINVDKRVLDNIAYRILVWHTLDKSKGEIIDYDSINFDQYVSDDMPKLQNKESAFEALDDETRNHILQLEEYVNSKIRIFEDDEPGVVQLGNRFDNNRILSVIATVDDSDLLESNQLFVTVAPTDSSHYKSTYVGSKDSQRQMMQTIEPSNEIHEQFKGTYIEEVVNEVKRIIEVNKMKMGRVRVLRMPVRSCYTYHRDPDKYRFHIPLHAKEGSFFIVGGKLFTLTDLGALYRVKTTDLHTAVNSSPEDRYHLVFDTYI